jgi:hypothetical protein
VAGLETGDSITLPSSVLFLDLSLPVKVIGKEAFYGSQLKSIVVSRSLEILYSSIFSGCKLLSSVLFETHSRLRRVESQAFS